MRTLALTFVVLMMSASEASAQVPPSPTCGDGTCQLLFESCRNCPADCGGPCGTAAGSSCGGVGMCGQSTASCFCDIFCFGLGDCCLDICLHCPNACPGSLPSCGDTVCAADETCASCPSDCGQCAVCGDGTCQPGAGEGCDTCAADCGDCCGDTACDGGAGEDCASCSSDCGACQKCGNGVCEELFGENSTTCPPDCPSKCEDGHCDLLVESCSTCPADCGDCEGIVIATNETNTCKGYCGKNRDTCWCDAFCHLYGDCCPDMCDDCPIMPSCNSVCGDNVCGVDENCTNCKQDCTWCPECGDGVCQQSEVCKTVTGAYGDAECEPDCGACCGNGVCDPDETNANCPADCTAPCGDNTCDDTQGEDCVSCATDCGQCCGDGQCKPEHGETCQFCPEDCMACPPGPTCGDLNCDADGGENCFTCDTDCPVCLCTDAPDIIPTPIAAITDMWKVKVGVEKSEGVYLDFDGSLDFSKGCGADVVLGAGVKVVPYEFEVDSSFKQSNNNGNFTAECKAEISRTESFEVHACVLGRTANGEASHQIKGECAYDGHCPLSSVPKWTCNTEQYCCDVTNQVGLKVGLDWPLKLGKLNKKGKASRFLKRIEKYAKFSIGASAGGNVGYLDATKYSKGPTCSCTKAIDGNRRTELELYIKGSGGVQLFDSEKLKGSVTLKGVGCVSVGKNYGGCNLAEEVTSGGRLKLAFEFDVGGFLKFAGVALSFPENQPPGQVGCF